MFVCPIYLLLIGGCIKCPSLTLHNLYMKNNANPQSYQPALPFVGFDEYSKNRCLRIHVHLSLMHHKHTLILFSAVSNYRFFLPAD